LGGAIRVEDVYDTDIDDVWDACTSRKRWCAMIWLVLVRASHPCAYPAKT
jgi:hypothetical protein